ncbi:The BTB (BR-C, ttk and bab)/POZ (Pox virus and Zinc finger) domain [Ceratobasidium sp. AG-Ba]|nr:The BTB (BR-C, ttk and bab)/POZ (Pox virus and Zinc finger) domain [Ceratobasidium sp. AG-Ba]QRW10063.1 The BTB (BR-C, ttk and bab)/POZ (Pox virus and Zinc finger) domain [Ceratobasidium sp. AG-Ba]
MSTSLSPTRHSKYYFEDGNIVFLTNDNSLFRLHKSILKRHSIFFKEMFELGTSSPEDQTDKAFHMDGSSDDCPIQLGGGSAPATLRDAELEPLCKVLYDIPGISLSKLALDEIIALFHSANKFQFESIFVAAVEYLDTAPVPPWKRYSLGAVCRKQSWLLRSCSDICSLADYPPPELFVEFSYLNAQNLLSALLKAREEYRVKLAMYTQLLSKCPTNLDLQVTGNHSCSSCRGVIKKLLSEVLSGTSTNTDGSVSLPLLKDRMLKAIQPGTPHSPSICDPCRSKEDLIIAQALGPADLERRINELKPLFSL